MRIAALIGLWIIAYSAKPGTPRGREDKEWLQAFSLVMIIWYIMLHALAYFPAAIFGGFGDMVGACTGRVNHAF